MTAVPRQGSGHEPGVRRKLMLIVQSTSAESAQDYALSILQSHKWADGIVEKQAPVTSEMLGETGYLKNAYLQAREQGYGFIYYDPEPQS
jgi:hypothetical protein